jgi:hypothetical protein
LARLRIVATTSKPALAAITAVNSPNPLEQPVIRTFFLVFPIPADFIQLKN